jgi:hypothetical protein
MISKISKFSPNFKILKLEIKIENFHQILKFQKFQKISKFQKKIQNVHKTCSHHVHISEFSLIDDEVRVFRINIYPIRSRN